MVFTASVFDASKESEFDLLYHAGPPGQKQLTADTNRIWGRVSSHVYFLASRKAVEREYAQGERTEGRILYVVDGRCVPSETLIVTNQIAVWYDEIVDLEGALRLSGKSPDTPIRSLFKGEDDKNFREYLEKHKIETAEDIGRRLLEAKKEWFEKYTKPFNSNRINRYKRKETIIMIPGPIPVV